MSITIKLLEGEVNRLRTGIEEFLEVLDEADVTEEDRALAKLIDYKFTNKCDHNWISTECGAIRGTE